MTQQTRMTEHGKTPSLPLAPTAGVHRHACISTNRHTTRLPSASPQTLHDIGASGGCEPGGARLCAERQVRDGNVID